MRLYLFLAFLGLSLFSCSRVHPLKGDYSTHKYLVASSKSKEDVFRIIRETLKEKGVAISASEYQSGMIVSDWAYFTYSYTMEDMSGKLLNPDAFFVIARRKDLKKEKGPSTVRCNWFFRIEEIGQQVRVYIQTSNIEAFSDTYAGWRVEYQAYSTGKFEKGVMEAIR